MSQRKRQTLYDLLEKYKRRRARAESGLSRAVSMSIRAARLMLRYRSEIATQNRRLEEAMAAIDKGHLYLERAAPKRKQPGRQIELD